MKIKRTDDWARDVAAADGEAQLRNMMVVSDVNNNMPSLDAQQAKKNAKKAKKKAKKQKKKDAQQKTPAAPVQEVQVDTDVVIVEADKGKPGVPAVDIV